MAESRPEFVHLHVHSHYSLLDGTCKVGELVDRAVEQGQKALALTDHGNLYGAVSFHDLARARGLKPILGMEAYVAEKTIRKKSNNLDNRSSHLTLLAKDERGWRNLVRLASIASLEGMHYKPRIDKELLAAHSEGLLALSGCLQGEVNLHLRAEDMEKAREAAARYRDIFGQKDFYLELMRIGIPLQDRCNEGLLQLSRELELKIVATNDAHYLERDGWKTQDMLIAINTGKLLADESRFRMSTRETYLRSSEEMARLFADLPGALAGTLEVAEKCNVELPRGVYHLPRFQPEGGEKTEAFFRRLCREGLVERYGDPLSPEVEDRLAAETEVILEMGFSSYFLITWDFIRHARSVGVPVGPGRGSAAGSIVAYALGITDIDPLKYDLLFERFLNKERVSMPDIDIDFCREGRQEIIEYVREKYGRDSVCNIITFTTLATKRALRDVGRALDIPLPVVDRICKKIPDGPGASLEEAKRDPDVREMAEEDPRIEELFEYSKRIRGIARDPSTHAAGVVICDRPVVEFAPLSRPQDEVVTQWQMSEVERMGLLKMDFLGLKNLTALDKSVRLVKEHRQIDLDLRHLPLDDEKTFELLRHGDTSGIFQFESQSMRDLMTRLKPDKFEDLIALNALHRPGPLNSGMADNYVANKAGTRPIRYPHPDLEDILRDTYGNIVYQEQVMLISVRFGGLTLNDADNLRKAMGKKKREVMGAYREKFITGAAGKGYEESLARELFDTMAEFAQYGFNKSHATAYALVAYQTAYMKANYPLEFLCGLMTCDAGDSDKLYNLVADAKVRGIRVLPPDVNRSEVHFTVDGRAIRFALVAIKGVGEPAAAAIVDGRGAAGGEFRDLDHFCERVSMECCCKGAMEGLVYAGAMDSICPSRNQAMAELERAMRAGAELQADRRRGQKSLFGEAGEVSVRSSGSGRKRTTRLPEWCQREKLTREKEALGFFLSGHPFEEKGSFYRRLAGSTIARCLAAAKPGDVTLAGMVCRLKEWPVKKGTNAGRRMAKFQLEDLTGTITAIAFADAWEEARHKVEEDTVVFALGRVRIEEEKRELRVAEIYTEAEMLAERLESLTLTLDDEFFSHPDKPARLRAILERHRGGRKIFFKIVEEDQVTTVSSDQDRRITIGEPLITELSELLPAKSIGFNLLPPPRARRRSYRRNRRQEG